MGNLELEPRIRQKSETSAFNIEYGSIYTDSEIKQDIVSYLLEYRLKTQRFSYQLEFDRASGKVRDIHRKESMEKKGNLAILEKTAHGLTARREEAELKGILNLQEQLKKAKDGDLVVWLSPPGPREEGYGDYGFAYTGEVKSKADGLSLEMTAIRLDHSTLSQFNNALSEISNQEVNFETAEQFLESPHVVQKSTVGEIEDVLSRQFSFSEDKLKATRDGSIICEANDLIEQYVKILKTGDRKDKIKFLHVLENYIIESDRRKKYHGEIIVFKEKRNLRKLPPVYDHEPEKVLGSCGASSIKSSNIFRGDGLNLLSGSDEFGSLTFSCPSCGETNTRSHGELISNCQHCNSTEVGCE